MEMLLGELQNARKTVVVDVGANPVNQQQMPPYGALLKAGGCHVIGFEPQESAFNALQEAKSENETYYPFAVGDGKPFDLRLYRDLGMTSIYDPYLPGLRSINKERLGVVNKTVTMDSVALDKAPDLPQFDLLKIDIQGAEKLVFKGAKKMLKSALCVIVEVRYLRLYIGEPMLGGIDDELLKQGFCLHKFLFNKTRMMKNSQSDRLIRRRVLDQLVDGDAVYIRNVSEPENLDVDQLKHMAILASGVFGSHSLAIYCLDELVARKAVAADLPKRYVDLMPAELRNDA